MIQSDIEIYIRDVKIDRLEAWLNERFDAVELAPLERGKGFRGRLRHNGQPVGLFLFFQAGGKQFASLWFNSGHTPWASDLECAREAAGALGVEIRCSTGIWQEGEAEESLWWSLVDGEERQIPWD